MGVFFCHPLLRLDTLTPTMASQARPPLVPWPATTWSRWAAMGRLSSVPVPRTLLLLLKAPASTVYEEKFGGDRNMFNVGMYCTRMMARGIRIGLVIDCTSLDLEDFEALPATASTSILSSSLSVDPRVRYFHNPSEWDDYDVEYHRLVPPKNVDGSDESTTKNLLAPQALPEFCNVVSKFLQRSRGKDAISHVAIFDSRGGLGAGAYLVGGYMCQMMKAPVHAALQALKEGTPTQPSDIITSDGEKGMDKWGLCDPRLVQDLQTRFVGRVEIHMDGRRPSWWYAVEELNEEDIDGNDNDKPQRKKRRTEDKEIVISSCSVSNEDDKIQTTNHNTQQQYQDVATNLQNPGIKPTNMLPEGWVCVWSKSQKRWYFFHKTTNKSVWDIKHINIMEVG